MIQKLRFLIKHSTLVTFSDAALGSEVRLNMKISGRSIMAFEGDLEDVIERSHAVLSAALPEAR